LPVERVNYPKPDSFRFPQLGWLRIDNNTKETLLSQDESLKITTLDELTPKGSLLEQLRQLNAMMSTILPHRVRAIVSQTIRRDTRLVRSLKSFNNYSCQFPGCGVKIPKRKGGWYIEVAHIKPVAEGGRSVLGNLLVLCPNHHKEFDYGELEIREQTVEVVRGKLNGKEFVIRSEVNED
jgi:predicted restriction endonuclease